MTLSEKFYRLFRRRNGASNYTYVPPRKEEIENLYINTLDQIRNQSFDICQMVFQMTGDEDLRDEFKEIILGSTHDPYQILVFIESFYSLLNMAAEDVIEEEEVQRLRLIDLKKTKLDITSCTLTAEQVAKLDSIEEIIRNKVTSEILADSKETLTAGSKAKLETLEMEHKNLQAKINAEKDRVTLNKEITSNANDNMKSQVLRYFEGQLQKFPEHAALLEEELDKALQALDQIDFE